MRDPEMIAWRRSYRDLKLGDQDESFEESDLRGTVEAFSALAELIRLYREKWDGQP